MGRRFSWWGLVVALAALAGCQQLLGGDIPNWVKPPTPESHYYFPILAGLPHDMDCNTCHGGFPTFKQFQCISCHEHSQEVLDPIHVGIANYYDSVQCYDCHPDGTANSGLSRDDHTIALSLFPINAGTNHAEVACNDCHIDPTDRTVDACPQCHYDQVPTLDNSHSQVGDYVANDNQMCKMCHPDGEIPVSVSTHRSQYFGMQGPGAHKDCTRCHLDRRVDRPFESVDYAASFSCEGACHEHTQNRTNNQHGGVNGYTYDFAECVSCHPTGRKD